MFSLVERGGNIRSLALDHNMVGPFVRKHSRPMPNKSVKQDDPEQSKRFIEAAKKAEGGMIFHAALPVD